MCFEDQEKDFDIKCNFDFCLIADTADGGRMGNSLIYPAGV